MPQIDRLKREVTYRRAPYDTNLRARVVNIDGKVNKPEWPTQAPESPLELLIADCRGCEAWRTSWVGSWYLAMDALNMRSTYYASTTPWNERLYATAYTKFTDAARQGSAEWGMNIIEARKSLNTFVNLSLSAAALVSSFVAANRNAVRWLASHRDSTPRSVAKKSARLQNRLRAAKVKSERVRLSNEIWILDQVAAALLAYRYGIAPIMSDLAHTAQIMSSPYKDAVSLRKSAKSSWNGTDSAWDDKWTGTESVVLRATCSVSNPNLLLANRLGLINPAVWLWEAIPWSFVVDWWVGIGNFAQNFTALVGLSLSSASVTRTRSWNGTWVLAAPEVTYVPKGNMLFFGKRKVRTTGSLPVPLSASYGTGLNIQRGQNALALIVQQWTQKGLKPLLRA